MQELEEDGSYGQESPEVVLVRSPAAAWHLARLQAYRHVMAWLDDVQVCERLQQGVEACWADAIIALAQTPEHQEDLLVIGPPDEVYLDTKEGIAAMSWRQGKQPEYVDAWGFLKVSPSNQHSVPEIALSTPFRPVVLAGLPADTTIIPVRDPRHTAVAAVNEVIGAIDRDLDRVLRRYEGAEAWRAVRSHVSFLAAAARVAVESLPADSFRDWSRPDTTVCALEGVAERIEMLALTTRAQQGLALHYVTQAYARAQDDADDHHEDPARKVEALQVRVSAMEAYVRRVLDVLNEGVATAAQIGLRGVEMMFIFRPMPASVPVLAIVRQS